MPDFSVAFVLLKKPIEDLYGLATGFVQDQIAVMKTQVKIKNLHSRLYESQRVKTIWHTDKPRSLSSFFYPVSIKAQEDIEANPVKINSLSNLPNKHTIILGTVGQGKSILLRYLVGREIKSGSHIPLLCELRNIESQSLMDYLVERFAILLQMPPDEKLFSFFASHGKIAFLLDGFDEINPDKVPRISQELEDLSNKFNTCHITITSRPDSECRHLTNFHTVEIQELAHDDLEDFYRRIGHDIDFATRLVSAINKSPTKIRELVVTPLLATLLAISYRVAHKIPLDFSEFYEELFQILLVRHDSSKLGWQRSRKTGLNAREIQQVFEMLCFATRKAHLVAIDSEAAIEITTKCLSDAGLAADPQYVIDDIKRVTCLLVAEGKKLQFVHSSVQEFFAARFVKTRTDPVAANFYEQLSSKNQWPYWQEELLFLRQIDHYRSMKYFFTLDLGKTLQFLLNDNSLTLPAAAIRYLEGMAVEKNMVDKNGVSAARYRLQRIRKFTSYHIQLIDNRIFGRLFSAGWNKGFIANATSKQRTYVQIAEDKGDSELENILTLVIAMITSQQSDLNKILELIVKEESTSGLIDLTD
ncbi:MAG: NACHT domain-containing protein [Nitrosomonadaceae bacterium]|nr:MAG: NACHT domain-containing protein [Nitrosomonadaceae bacterium]